MVQVRTTVLSAEIQRLKFPKMEWDWTKSRDKQTKTMELSLPRWN